MIKLISMLNNLSKLEVYKFKSGKFIIFSPISNLVIFINNDSLINLSPNILMK